MSGIEQQPALRQRVLSLSMKGVEAAKRRLSKRLIKYEVNLVPDKAKLADVPDNFELFLPFLGSLPGNLRRIEQTKRDLQLPFSGTDAMAEIQVEGKNNLAI